MDVGTARKPVTSRWWLGIIAGVGVLGSTIMLWRFQVYYQARQRVQAAEREARLAAFRAEAEAKQLEAERQVARVKSVDRVGQLYREIDNLTHLGERVETSLRDRPRALKESESKARTIP